MTGSPAPPAHTTSLHVAAFIVTGMVTTVLGPILPELLEAWHLTDAAAGALFTAQFAGSVTAGALSGLLVARLGDGRTLAVGYATMCAGLLSMAAGTYAWAVAGACAAGVGMGCVIPPTNLLVARGRREQAASALGGLNFAWGIGASVWPLIVSLSVRFWGIRPPLIALALLCAVAAARIATVAATRGDGVGAGLPPRTTSSSRVALFAALIFLYGGTEMALGGWLPELARRLPDAGSSARAAAVGAAFWGGLTAGRGLIALRLERRYENASLFVGLALTASCVVLLATTRLAAVVPVAAGLSGLGLGPVFPVTAAAMAREMPTRIAGPLLALGALGGATIPWMVGIISDGSRSLATGVGSLLVTLAALAILHARRPGSDATRPT